MAYPSAAAEEITSIFQEIINNNLKYCALCLRTERERKLVDPEAFMKCLAVMRLRAPVVNSICYVCEAQAARAVSLFQAISFASSVNRWFKDMASKLNCVEEMPTHLDKYMGSENSNWPRAVGLAPLPLPTAWKQVRGRCELVQTEVLLVSDAVQSNSVLSVSTSTLTRGPRLPPPPGPPLACHTDITEPKVESIVIIEDDDEPPPPPPPAPPVPPMPLIVSIHQLLEHSEQNAAAFVPNEMQLLSRHKDGLNFILHPIVTGNDNQCYVPSLSAKLVQGQLVYMDPAGIRFVSAPEDSQVQASQLRSLLEGKQEKAPPPPAAPAPARARRLPGGRIDWEDKIPMDVISFVDATDPNASQILQPESPPQDPLSKRRHIDRDVIDLC